MIGRRFEEDDPLQAGAEFIYCHSRSLSGQSTMTPRWLQLLDEP